MKYLIDAQLPLKLKNLLSSKGYDAIHTLELEQQNRTSDLIIIEHSKAAECVIITKDSDFLLSYLLNKTPRKLLIVKTGNISNKALINLFDLNIGAIDNHFLNHSLIELYKDEIVVHNGD